MVQDAVGDLIGNVARNAIQGCRLGMWDVEYVMWLGIWSGMVLKL